MIGDDGLNFTNNDENSYHVVTGSGCSQDTILDGLTIIAGNANGTSLDSDGGGMLNNNGSPTLIDCTFKRNWADSNGGGIANHNNSNPILNNCIFRENFADFGGGMSSEASNPTFVNCIFSRNAAISSGGGLHNRDNSSLQ